MSKQDLFDNSYQQIAIYQGATRSTTFSFVVSSNEWHIGNRHKEHIYEVIKKLTAGFYVVCRKCGERGYFSRVGFIYYAPCQCLSCGG
jgi:hypothetical protein